MTEEDPKQRSTKSVLTDEHQTYIDNFMDSCSFSYNQQTGTYFMYDELMYRTVSEDDVLYYVLSNITNTASSSLINVKQQLTKQIIKQIQTKQLIKQIPNSQTIQAVLSLLCPMIFLTKTDAKHFLTVLGDIILKKQSDKVYYVDVQNEPLIALLEQWVKIIGQHIQHRFKYKYRYSEKHTQDDYRIIKMNTQLTFDVIKQVLEIHAINIINVSAHYSVRYVCADDFLTEYCNEPNNHVFYLKNNTDEEIVTDFTRRFLTTLQTTEKRTTLQFSHMTYLWKLFLEQQGIPSCISAERFKVLVTKVLSPDFVDEVTGGFVNIYSVYLPNVDEFMRFWEKHVFIDGRQTTYEVDELVHIIKDEMGNKLTESTIIACISHFYPQVEIKDNKMVCGIFVDLWDKRANVKEFLAEHGQNVHINKLYAIYCVEKKHTRRIVSKQFFKTIYDEGVLSVGQNIGYTTDDTCAV